MASGIQFDATTGQWGYDQGNGTWTFPVEDRRQNVINTALNSEGFNGTLPPIENAYRPLEGFFEGRYKMAANGLTDPNASLLDKAFYTVAGAGVLIPSLLEAPVTDLYNFANNASIAGQYAARADLQADPSDATIDRLSAVGCRL